MKKLGNTCVLLFLLILAACGGGGSSGAGKVSSATARPGGDDDERRGPPPEAIEACSSKSEGDTCSFSGRRGEALEGTCFVPPSDGNNLACKPEGGRGGHRQNGGGRE